MEEVLWRRFVVEVCGGTLLISFVEEVCGGGGGFVEAVCGEVL